jgi:hypothetical protein
VWVTAEWALYGKTGSDTGAHLLSCSSGPLGPDNFGDALTRYHVGTGVPLPQVAISWLSDKEKRSDLSYIAIAIYDKPQDAQYDAVGREIVQTSYFCIPYHEAAAGAVSYRTMYEQFRKFPLPGRKPSPIHVRLPSGRVLVPTDGKVAYVAALLLTGEPVCILDADQVSFLDRLRFIDAVAALLPYGMRSQLSASTWVSSTFREHKFRLFFAAAPRADSSDRMVNWNAADYPPIEDLFANEYWAWLRSEINLPATWLAGEQGKLSFSRPDIFKLLERAGVPASHLVPAQFPAPGAARAIAPSRARSMPHGPTVEELLASSARWFGSSDGKVFKAGIEELRGHLDDPGLAERRAEYRQLIVVHGLLRKGSVLVDDKLKTEFFKVLLQLAFGTPLSYTDYCNVEACAGIDQPLPIAVLQAMQRAGIESTRARLLAAEALGPKKLKSEFRAIASDPDNLVRTVVCADLLSRHARVICNILMRELNVKSGIFDLRARFGNFSQQNLRRALHRYGYLAVALDAHFPAEPDYQLRTLTELLRAAYGPRLDRPAITTILVNSLSVPTVALHAAVLRMIDPGDVPLAEHEFSRGCLGNTRFETRVRDELRLLISGDQAKTKPIDAPPPSLDEPSAPEPGRGRWHRASAGPEAS